MLIHYLHATHRNKDQPEDIKAASAGLIAGDALLEGDNRLVPYVGRAYEKLRLMPSETHANGWVYQNCKTEANELLQAAIQMERTASAQAP